MLAQKERTRKSEYAREQAKASKNVLVPACENRPRRKRLEDDDGNWLRWYFDDPNDSLDSRFWYDFTFQQKEMIEAIRRAILHGGDQALAASRGEGKTKLFERLLLKYTLQGIVPFALLLAATGSKAEDSLASIKAAIETNNRLYADYPEVCAPVRALEYTPNRAHYQTVSGRRHDNPRRKYEFFPSRFIWCGQQITLPNVPGSPSACAVIATRGLDAEVRGLNKFNRRVGVVGIDDPDTEETVGTEEQAKKLEARIERGVAFLGGQQKSAARIMLTTLQRRECVSARFTDPKQKPSWKGKRFRFLIERPARQDLWDEYVAQWQADLQTGDEYARKANTIYAEHRADMDLGAVVANPNRFDGSPTPDGTPKESSALQHYFNQVARLGQDAVSTEYDNDPPEETGPQESGISAYRIQTQVSGYPRRVIPPGCVKLTQGIDCRKVALHYVVRAWKEDGTGYVIDYGVEEVRGTVVGSDEGLDEALIRALRSRREDMLSTPYAFEDGRGVAIDQTLIDAGWRTETIYAFCREAGLGWRPFMGFGKSTGCAGHAFYAPVRATQDKRIGHHWFMSRQPHGIWLVCDDADHWKAWEHDHWMRDPLRAGALLNFGMAPENPARLSQDQKGHFSYSKHITAEIEVEEPVKGVLKRYWKVKSDNNHYFDASRMATVAASLCGIQLGGGVNGKTVQVKRRSMAELAGAARRQG